MRTLLVATLVFATPAVGADFRGTDFGSACAAITEREAALGSEQLSISGSAVAVYKFKGRALDQDVRLTYICKDGALALGDMHFHAETYNQAVSVFLAAYEFYASLYGQTYLAYVSDDKKSADFVLPALGAATHDLYFASWRAQGLRVKLDLLSRDHLPHDPGQKWLVMIVTTADGE